jgi:hypothetical protein
MVFFLSFPSSRLLKRPRDQMPTDGVHAQDPHTGHFVYKQLFVAIPGSLPLSLLSFFPTVKLPPLHRLSSSSLPYSLC